MSTVRTLVVVGGVVALVALGAVAASLAGDGGDGSANGSVPVGGRDELVGSWVLVNHYAAPSPVVGTVRMVFTEEGRVLAETGCNTLRGSVEVEDGALVTGPLMSTRMACEPPLMEQERWISEMLSSRPRLELSGPYLALHWGEGERYWVGFAREGVPEASVPATP